MEGDLRGRELKPPRTREKESPVNRLSVILFGAGPTLAEGAALGTPPDTDGHPMWPLRWGSTAVCSAHRWAEMGREGGGAVLHLPPGPPLPIAGNYPNGAG